MTKVAIGNLELHVTHACNLQCQSCSHFSNYGLNGHLSLAAADRYMGSWSPRIHPRLFSLLGGEPTLHPDLAEFVEIAAGHWTSSTIQLVTNGWFLQRHPRLPEVLEKHKVRLEISVHHDGPEYQSKVADVRNVVEAWQQSYQFPVNWRPSFRLWRHAYKGYGPTMEPYQDGSPEKSWKHCPCKWCPQILHGRLFKCPPIAYLPMLDEKFGLSESWKPYLGYEPLAPGCTQAELQEFLTRKTEDICGMCPAVPERFLLPSPLPQVRGPATIQSEEPLISISKDG